MKKNISLMVLGGLLVVSLLTVALVSKRQDVRQRAQVASTSFLETFDGLPSSPLAYRSNRVATAVHHRNLPGDQFDHDTGNPPSMPAQHGTDCVPPPAIHTIVNRADFVFNCRNHIMTSMNGKPYGDTVLTPAAEVDWSSGQATIRWAMSTARGSARDWFDIFITPQADFMALPASAIVDNDLNGPPKNSLFVSLDLFTDAIGSGLYRNGVLQSWPQSLDSQYFSSVVVPDPARRDVFELTITKAGRVTLRMPAYNNAVIFDEQHSSPLPFDGGMVQFSHHSYSPEKGCDLDPRFRPSVNQPCGEGTTWHWDDIFISPAKPLNLINANPGYAGGAATTTRFTFDSPVPTNAKLEFSALGAVDLNFGSGFTRAVPTETDKDVLHASSYFVSAPAGATYVDVRLSNESATQSFMLHAKDLHVWSPGSTIIVPTNTPIPTSPVTPTPTLAQTTPTPTTPVIATTTPSPTPTRTPTPTPTRTPTPTPTRTPTPIPTSIPTSTPTGTVSCNKTGDLNCDNQVGIIDLSILLSNWNSANTVADINRDGIVSIIDLSIMLSNWGL